jgi:Carbohydrate family 9 binding domain-like/Domain of unknown function (DUF5916)
MLIALILAVFVIGTARADGPGVAVVARADEAFGKNDFAGAATLYAEALEKGGLATKQALQCYVQLGVSQVAVGRERDARISFRNAALLDPHFVLPTSVGRKARALADDMRKDARTTGAYQLTIEAPETAQPGKPFHVTATMTAAHAALVSKVRITALEPTTDGSFEKVEASSTTVGFDVPATIAVSDQKVSVRVEAVDAHDNRLVVVWTRVKIAAAAGGIVAVAPSAVDGGAEPAAFDAGAAPPAGGTVITTKTDGDSENGEGTGPWSVPHGSKRYTGARARGTPVIDGFLDDAVWVTAPKDDRFFSTRSKPYGQPTTEPTVVQVAYDEENLYVAFRCGYGKPGPKDDSFTSDEQTLLAESESVAVLVDPVHGHTGAYEFAVSPVGARADVELSDQGSVVNSDWRGIWQSATQQTANGWTAEIKIPWGTMRMPGHDEAFDLGVNFARREPTSGEYSLWALHPPATESFDTNFFGHLEGLSNVHPGQRLYIEPYFAFAFDRTPPPTQSTLTDFTGTNGQFRAYGGAYVRLRPPGPFRADATFNPDFSAVNPDQALANFDRFELEFPEARPFFAEDNPRFQFGAPRYLFGDLGAQLFYSRRLGIDTNTAGLTQAVPILWGVKSVLRTGGTEAALMNVETSPANRGISLADNATIGRVTQTYEGQRIGAIILNRAGDHGAYTAGGADVNLAFYERHLQLSGFYAGSQSAALGSSGTGEGTIAWRSQDFYAQATYMDIGKAFDAPLGFFPITGVRSEQFAVGYTPVIRSDLVQQVFIDTQMALARDRDTDQRVFDRGVVAASVQTIQQAIVQVGVQPAIENVSTPFPIGNGRITVPPGSYKVLVTQVDFSSAPRRTIVWGVGYVGGDLFDGQRRAPSATFGLNLGRLSTRAKYQVFILSYGPERFTGHQLDASATYSYSPLAKTTLLVGTNTVSARAVAQLVTAVQFWTASTVSLALRGVSGSTIDTPAQDWYDRPDFSAIVSMAVGVTPF